MKKIFKDRKLGGVTPFDIILTTIILVMTLVIVYPLYYVIISSLSDPMEMYNGNTLLWVKGFTIDSYKRVWGEKLIWIGYRNTIFYTVFGTLYNLTLTFMAAYVVSKKNLPGQKVITWFFFLTMFIGGGLIPSFLLNKSLGLVNNPLICIVGSGVSAYNMLVVKNYFASSIPEELYDAAYMDGAGEGYTFVKITLPLSKPIIAVMSLFYGVGEWNNYTTSLFYLYKPSYQTLQHQINKILDANLAMELDMATTAAERMEVMENYMASQGMKYALILIGSLPMLIAYPFIQKYFTKGVMVGSVKG